MPTSASKHVNRLLILSQLPDLSGTAMLPRALARAGFEVGTVSSPGSLLPLSRYISLAATYQHDPCTTAEGLWSTLVEAARRWPYDLILPAEDFSARLLCRFADQIDDGQLEDGPLGAVIRRSVVPRDHRAAAYRRPATVAAAAALGIRVPEQIRPESADQVRAFCRDRGLPVVVKQNTSMGGAGVSILHDAEAAAAAALKAPGRVMVQRFIDGRPASISFAADQGRLLAAFCFAAVVCHPPAIGAATVIEVIDQPDMVEAARRLAGAIGFTGIAGLDFMIDRDGVPWFLELNPRLPQTAYLGAGIGCDLCGALFAGLSGAPAAGPLHGSVGKTQALFPTEWQRDPDSAYLQSAAPHIPWDDARLVSAMMQKFAPPERRPSIQVWP